jgi:nucleotide-binding universal stress UspA family protein
MVRRDEARRAIADALPFLIAAPSGVGLIVIGAYSHARSVEMVFGGVTRTLLKQAPIPVLMSR